MDKIRLAVKVCISVCKRHPHKNNKSKWWNRQSEAGLLHKKHAHNKYLLSQNENYEIEYERLTPSPLFVVCLKPPVHILSY